MSNLRIILLDKASSVGGNSAKASSGINAVHPPAGDSNDLFAADTTKSGGGLSKPELVDVLVVGAVGLGLDV